MKAYNGFPGEYRASQYVVLKAAWDRGDLARPSRCVACRQTGGSMNAHHEDYSQPLSYDELCCVCHLMVHCRQRNAAAWDQYRRAVAAGYQPPATKQPQAMGAVRFLTTRDPSTWPGEHHANAPRETTVLDNYPLERGYVHPNARSFTDPELPI